MYDDGYGDDPGALDEEEELESAELDGRRMFTFADVSLAMRRGVRLGFACGHDILRITLDDDLQKREVVERPLILRRLQASYEKAREFVMENFGD